MLKKLREWMARPSAKQQSVIRQLVDGDKYASELVAGSDGLLRSGSVYVLLGRMEEAGLIAGRNDSPTVHGPGRRRYRVTASGERLISQ